MANFFISAVLFEEAVILGAASDALAYKYSSPSCYYQSGTNLHDLPYCVLERTVSIRGLVMPWLIIIVPHPVTISQAPTYMIYPTVF